MKDPDNFFEEFSRTSETPSVSDRKFGLTMTVALFALGGWYMLKIEPWNWWALAPAGGFLIVSLLRPGILAIPNKLWSRLGLLLNRLVSPVILTLLFFLFVTPYGWILRTVKGDWLGLKYNPTAHTYWIQRTPPGPPPDSLRNQF